MPFWWRCRFRLRLRFRWRCKYWCQGTSHTRPYSGCVSVSGVITRRTFQLCTSSILKSNICFVPRDLCLYVRCRPRPWKSSVFVNLKWLNDNGCNLLCTWLSFSSWVLTAPASRPHQRRLFSDLCSLSTPSNADCQSAIFFVAAFRLSDPWDANSVLLSIIRDFVSNLLLPGGDKHILNWFRDIGERFLNIITCEEREEELALHIACVSKKVPNESTTRHDITPLKRRG